MISEFALSIGSGVAANTSRLIQERVIVTKQIRVAALRGFVSSGDSRPLTGTQVKAFQQLTVSKSLCPAGREVGSTSADGQGAFRFTLPAGRYCIVLPSKGFNEMCYTDILVSPRSRNRRALRITMSVAT